MLKASEEEDDLPAGKSFIEEADKEKEKERLAAKIRALD